MGKTRVAVDVGGTFTDVCIMDEETGDIRIEKTASTPDDPMVAVMNGVEQGGIDLSDVTLFSHGTTVATNALITRRLPRTAMVCTEGFRDVVEIRRANKEDLWDTYKDVAKPYIPGATVFPCASASMRTATCSSRSTRMAPVRSRASLGGAAWRRSPSAS